jgi:hypothetical protein
MVIRMVREPMSDGSEAYSVVALSDGADTVHLRVGGREDARDLAYALADTIRSFSVELVTAVWARSGPRRPLHSQSPRLAPPAM